MGTLSQLGQPNSDVPLVQLGQIESLENRSKIPQVAKISPPRDPAEQRLEEVGAGRL